MTHHHTTDQQLAELAENLNAQLDAAEDRFHRRMEEVEAQADWAMRGAFLVMLVLLMLLYLWWR
jgi:hypothetical protein